MKNIEILNSEGIAGVYDDALRIRKKVFIGEQGIDPDLEVDDLDEKSWHFVAYLEKKPISTARLFIEGDIGILGRVATLKDYRRCGFSREIIKEIEKLAKELTLKSIYLHAQVSAIPFYQRLGYQAEGLEFEEAGIKHQGMRKQL